MQSMISLDRTYSLVSDEQLNRMAPLVQTAHYVLEERSGAGKEFLGWMDLPDFDPTELARIQEVAARIREKSQVLVVVGIGGSYLGARAAIEMLSPSFGRRDLEVIYAGHHLSASYHAELLDYLDQFDVTLNVISKSGTTTEPAIAFRFLRKYMEERYGVAGAKERIVVTTDKETGALRQLATELGYTSFVIPDDVGGRFSVLTPVGLLPIASAGIDVEKILEGAKAAKAAYATPALADNMCYQYAALRHIYYAMGKAMEIFVSYEPSLFYFAEWWKQLFGESQGKDGQGLFPSSVSFTTDLHSLGQYIQDGRRLFFETVLNIQEPRQDLVVEKEDRDLDGLNYIAGKSVHEVNQKAMQGTLLAHVEGQVPNLVVNVPQIAPEYFGQLVYFFEKACAVGGYLMGVNPFDQPGVEAYKKKMFALLGKPGYQL